MDQLNPTTRPPDPVPAQTSQVQELLLPQTPSFHLKKLNCTQAVLTQHQEEGTAVTRVSLPMIFLPLSHQEPPRDALPPRSPPRMVPKHLSSGLKTCIFQQTRWGKLLGGDQGHWWPQEGAAQVETRITEALCGPQEAPPQPSSHQLLLERIIWEPG